MSRSNYDKPFYVDVGTSVVAIRCASNHDVVEQYNYAWSPGTLKLAEDICDRMNKEAEIGKPLRNCDVGTVKEQIRRFREFCETEICKRYRCRHGCKATCIDRCAISWGQMPYEAKEGEGRRREVRNFETAMTRWPDKVELFAWARYRRGEIPTQEEFDYIDGRAKSKFHNAEFIELHRKFVVPVTSNEVWWHFRWIDFSQKKGENK